MTPPQSHTYLAALDLDTEKRDEVMRLLPAWTAAAVRRDSHSKTAIEINCEPLAAPVLELIQAGVWRSRSSPSLVGGREPFQEQTAEQT